MVGRSSVGDDNHILSYPFLCSFILYFSFFGSNENDAGFKLGRGSDVVTLKMCHVYKKRYVKTFLILNIDYI